MSKLAGKSLQQALKMLDKQVKQIQERLLATLEKAFAIVKSGIPYQPNYTKIST